MTDLVYQEQQQQQQCMTTSFSEDTLITPTLIKQKSTDYATNNTTDSAVSQLLAKLDEGGQTIANLRSILTLKTAELNELMAQLEMTNQAITNVESTTCHIESMLKELGLSMQDGTSTRELLMSAEASLDSAIKSAIDIYQEQRQPPMQSYNRYRPASTTSGKSDSYDHQRRQSSVNHQNNSNNASSARFVSRIRYKPDNKHILRQLNDRLRELELDAGKFFETIGTTSDVQALQKAYVDLDLAKTIALSAKSNLKRRKILLTSSRRRNVVDQVKILGEKIREGVDMWKTYTRNAPMMVNGEDILTVLDLQDNLLDNSNNLPSSSSRMSIDLKSRGCSPTNSSSSTTNYSNPSRPAWRQSITSISSSSRPDAAAATAAAQPEQQKQQRHRSSSISSVSSIPVLAVPNPPPPMPHMKKTAAYRHSVTTMTNHTMSSSRPSVKANIGVSRVRTSSLTNKNKDSVTKSVFPSHTTSSTSPVSSSSNNAHAVPTSPPLTPSSANNTLLSDTSNSNNSSGSKLKPPTQRGPGSTLRIRSMLAKRNHQQIMSTK